MNNIMKRLASSGLSSRRNTGEDARTQSIDRIMSLMKNLSRLCLFAKSEYGRLLVQVHLYRTLLACGDYCGTTKARYIEVLEFTHFVTMFEFDGSSHFRGNKRLIQKINCSVVLDLGWGNIQEDLYTIEDRPKCES